MATPLMPHDKSVRRLLIALVFVASIFASPSYPSEKLNRQQTLARIKAVFGEPVPWDECVFRAVRSYGIRFRFDDSGSLFSLTVEPLRIIKDPDAHFNEESEPSLIGSEFDTLLAKISGISLVGKWKYDDPIGYSNANSSEYWAYYEHAFIKLIQRSDVPKSVSEFHLAYILNWSGIVTKKFTRTGGRHVPALIHTDDDEKYLVPPEIASKLRVGKRNTFQGARVTPFY